MVDWLSFLPALKHFTLFVLGMAAYCIFVFALYKRVSQRFIFAFTDRDCRNSKYPAFMKFWCRFVYGMKYVFVAPIFLFIWGAMFSAFILLMQDTIPLEQGLLISMALLAAIRICAHYSESLAEDVAKTVPLSLLALFLVDMTLIQFDDFWTKMRTIPTIWETLIVYFAVIVVLELLLRLYAAIAERDD
jgi:hypothetical protein